MQGKVLSFVTSILLLVVSLVSVTTSPARAEVRAVDILADFEGPAFPSEFFVFFGSSSVAVAPITVADNDTLMRPGQSGNNDVLRVAYNVVDFGGFGQAFELAGAQDWSNYTSFEFWFYGTASGLTYQAEISDNRSNPNVDSSERFDFEFTDNTAGWQYISIPFDAFTRATDFQPGGAPNDGFTLTEIWAWAIVLPNGVDTVYFDDVALSDMVAVTPLTVSIASNNTYIAEGASGNVAATLNRPMTNDDPFQVVVSYDTDIRASIATEGRDYAGASGMLTFFNGGPTQQTISIQTFDDTKFEGNERIVLQLSNPVGVELGVTTQASVFVIDNDPFEPKLLDDFERGAYLWQANNAVAMESLEIGAGSPQAVPGQDAFEHVLDVSTAIAVDAVIAGYLCKNDIVPVVILTTDAFDATTIDHTTVRFGNAAETHLTRDGLTRHETDYDGDGDLDLVFHFRVAATGYTCDATETVLTGETFGGQPIATGGDPAFGRDFAIGQDWSGDEALGFWFYGTGSGNEIVVTLKDNRLPDPGPFAWNLVWSDEFNGPAGTPANPANWSYEIGDVSPAGNNGWGNEERQYYTDDPANAANDGNGNLAITLQQANGVQQCYYGTCEYTSARLISRNKAEFAYGRIESRIKVPQGTGIWPAFWALGTDIDIVGWPQTGEIDFMEFVGRLPEEIFGTLHGPGYSGGASFGNVYQFGVPVFNDYHTFAVEWQPDRIDWYVDGILYHSATPANVAPNEWVFNDSFFLLLNVAVGGNFGGPIGPDLVPPQSMLVDYVRVYQSADTAERFKSSFVDNVAGWRQVVIPFASFSRSDNQPAGAPNDGLNLNDVWGYGFRLPDGGTTTGMLRLDQVRLQSASVRQQRRKRRSR